MRREAGAGVVRLTLSRGDRYNPLSRPMIAALQAELDALAADAGARVVVLAAEGRGFSAGHDLAEMRAHTEDPAWQSALFEECNRLLFDTLPCCQEDSRKRVKATRGSTSQASTQAMNSVTSTRRLAVSQL